MPSLELKRVSQRPNQPTMGVLCYEGVPFALTLEREWKNNETGKSCIPLGTYQCLRCKVSPDYNGDSPKFGNTFQVMDVPSRNRILCHKGNIDDDTHGCILVGEQFGILNGQRGILASKAGFAEFLDLLRYQDSFMLYVTNHYSPDVRNVL